MSFPNRGELISAHTASEIEDYAGRSVDNAPAQWYDMFKV